MQSNNRATMASRLATAALAAASLVTARLAEASSLCAQQPKPETVVTSPRLQVSVAAPERAFVQQPVAVTVTVAWQREWFANNGVSLFREAVDVPCHLELPWLRAAPERAVEVEDFDGQTAVSVVVGERKHRAQPLADVRRNGVVYARVALRIRWLPLAAGDARLAPVRARFAFATAWREHLLRGREPIDREDATVASEAHVLAVAALPPEAPDGFTGAVGQFVLDAISGGERVAVGDEFRIQVSVRGEGNLSRFRGLPKLQVDGFHVQGVAERKSDRGRRFDVDLVALRAGMTRVPGVSFVAFDPERSEYVTVRSPDVPVVVDPLPADRELDPRVQELVDADRQKRAPGWTTWAIRGGLLLLVLLGAWLSRRAVRGRGQRAIDDAVRALRLSCVQPVGGGEVDPQQVAERFERVLVLVSGSGREEAFAVPDTWERLQARGVAPAGMDRLRELHQQLDQARYGGELPPAEDLMAAVDTLAAAAAG
ncbi:MAG: hypothetical protein AB8H80_13700 [Planctomycetota bacterium]